MKYRENGKIICLFKICRKRKKVSIWSPHLSVPICVLSGYFSQLLKGDDFCFYTLKLEQEHLIRPSVLCELLKARASRPESCYGTGLIKVNAKLQEVWDTTTTLVDVL